MPKHYTVRLLWLNGGPTMVDHCQTETAAKSRLADWLNHFAGIKAVTIEDAKGKHIYNALGKYLFTVPATFLNR